MKLSSKFVNEGLGVRNPQNLVNLVYEWPQIPRNTQINSLKFSQNMKLFGKGVGDKGITF